GGVYFTVDRNSDDVGSGVLHELDELNGGVNVRRFGGRHGLDSDWIGISNRDRSDFYGTSLIAYDVYHEYCLCVTSLNETTISIPISAMNGRRY
ncbi:MAG: hypothetical protein ACI87E_004622, partial [Mariniblastus sp.]